MITGSSDEDMIDIHPGGIKELNEDTEGPPHPTSKSINL